MTRYVIILSPTPAKEFSVPLGTFAIQVPKDGTGPGYETVYKSLQSLVGEATGKGIAFQTFPGHVLFYGNTMCPLLGQLSRHGQALIPWCHDMGLVAAWAAVLYFTPLTPLMLMTPFMETERAAAVAVNRQLASAGLSAEQDNAIVGHKGQCMVIVGGPPPTWFVGMEIHSTIQNNIRRSCA